MSDFNNTSGCDPTIPEDVELQKLTPDLILCEKYQLKNEAGVGGMGVVWKAWDMVGERLVALKFVPPEIRHSDGAMEQVKTAFKTIQALNHQNIGPVYGLEKDETFGYFIVKKWLEGQPLSKMKLPPEQIPKVLAKVAAALDYAHSKRVMHRDVKPSNIYIETNGDVYLIDFGIAAEIQNSITNNTSSAVCRTSGTRPYMAPEQWRSLHQDGQTDQYALAVVAYQLYSGHLPFQNSDLALLRMAILQDPPEQIKNASAAVNAAILRALSKDRKDRFGSCREFVNALTKTPSTMQSPCSLNALTKQVHIRTAQSVSCPPPLPSQGKNMRQRSLRGKILAAILTLLKKIREIAFSKKGKWIAGGSLVLLIVLVYSFGGFWKKAGERMVVTVDGIEYAFHWCPPGKFQMGKNHERHYSYEDVAYDNNNHTVKLSKGFWMLETEVTQEMWESVMGENPSKFEGKQNPVENVSWEESQEFCQKLSQKLEQKVQLPTEAQWEYACRAGTTDDFAGDINLFGWYSGNSEETTHPVKQRLPNAWGLYDMHGNVCEWCSDYYYKKFYESSPDTDPENTAVFPSHVKRGGCWEYSDKKCASAYRGEEEYFTEPVVAEAEAVLDIGVAYEEAAPAVEEAAPAVEEEAPAAAEPAKSGDQTGRFGFRCCLIPAL